jgi:hypothetical protein
MPVGATSQRKTGGEARTVANVDVANFRTYIWGQANVCGVITQIRGQCITATIPAADIFQDCILEKNESTVWSPGYGEVIAVNFSQESPWQLVGASGSTWSCGISSEAAFVDGGLLWSQNYPRWGVWTYYTVH